MKNYSKDTQRKIAISQTKFKHSGKQQGLYQVLSSRAKSWRDCGVRAGGKAREHILGSPWLDKSFPTPCVCDPRWPLPEFQGHVPRRVHRRPRDMQECVQQIQIQTFQTNKPSIEKLLFWCIHKRNVPYHINKPARLAEPASPGTQGTNCDLLWNASAKQFQGQTQTSP